MRLATITIFFYFISFSSLAQWVITEKHEMPERIANNAVCEGFQNGKPYVYVFGALDETKEKEGIHQRCYRYDINADSWESIQDLPDTSGKVAAWATRIKDTIYIVGGYHVRIPSGSEYSSNKIHRFNTQTNSFMEDGASIPTKIDDQVQGLWRDSLIYVITGWNGELFSNTNTNKVQIYNPYTNTWQTGTPTPNNNNYKSFGASGTIIGDTIYYFGGATSGAGFGPQYQLRKGVINPLDPTEITWSIEAVSESGYRTAATSFNNTALWFGGSENTYNYDGIAYDGSGGVDPASRVFTYDTQEHEWDTLPLDVPMDLRGIAKLGEGRYIICGGMDSNQVVSKKTLFIEHQSVVGVSKAEQSTFSIYPNPVKNTVSISRIDNDEVIRIYDVKGGLVQENIYSPSLLDVSGLLPGLYFVEAKNIRQRFIKL